MKFNITKKHLILYFDLSCFSLLPVIFHLFFISERAVWNKASIFLVPTSLRTLAYDSSHHETIHLGWVAGITNIRQAMSVCVCVCACVCVYISTFVLIMSVQESGCDGSDKRLFYLCDRGVPSQQK